jgi:hypothetical protein
MQKSSATSFGECVAVESNDGILDDLKNETSVTIQ